MLFSPCRPECNYADVSGLNYHRWQDHPPPKGIKPLKGPVHIMVNRDFVKFLLKDPMGSRLVRWAMNTSFPDETLFPTINHNPQLGIRGTYANTDLCYYFKHKHRRPHKPSPDKRLTRYIDSKVDET